MSLQGTTVTVIARPEGPKQSRLVTRLLRLWLVMTVLFLSSSAYANPSRIVSIDLTATEILLVIADRSAVTAVTSLSANPAVSSVSDRIQGLPTTRGTAEEIVLLRPDLVLAGEYTQPATVLMLERLNIPLVQLSTAKNFDQVADNVRIIADAIGEVERGEILIDQMNTRLAQVKARQLPRRPRVAWYYTGGNSVGSDAITHAIIEAAGAENLTATLGHKGFTKLTLEAMVLHAPEFLLFGKYLKNVHTRGTGILEHPALRKVLSRERTIELPSRLLNCTSPFAVDGVEMLADALAAKVSS